MNNSYSLTLDETTRVERDSDSVKAKLYTELKSILCTCEVTSSKELKGIVLFYVAEKII